MYILLGAIQHAQFLKLPLYVAYVDFRRAFDSINRNMMFYKLLQRNYDGKIIRILYDMYQKTKSKVCVNGSLSSFLVDTLRVNQGGPNSPDTFKDFLADMGDYLSAHCSLVNSEQLLLLHLLWADDLILIDLHYSRRASNTIR